MVVLSNSNDYFFVYSNGAKYGGISIGVGPIFLLFTESFHVKGLEKEDFLELIELTVVNILITFVVGALVKNNNEKQLQLNGTKNILESILNNLEIGVWSIDKQRHLHTSKGVAKIYGVAHEDGAASRDFWKNSIHPEDCYVVAEIDRNWENLEAYQYEYRIQRENGEVRWIYNRGIPVLKENGELLRFDGINFDITKKKELEFKFLESAHWGSHYYLFMFFCSGSIIGEAKRKTSRVRKIKWEVEKACLNDTLTGLPNRFYFKEKLQNKFRDKVPVTLMFIDLDGFKQVNDRYGHDEGDLLLKEVSSKLNLLADETTFVSRIGGDEFTILLTGIDQVQSMNQAKRILNLLQINIHDIKISASIGIAASQNGDTPVTLIKHADTAMYKAKSAGKNNFYLHTDI